MSIYSQHTFHLQQTNDGYSLQGERLSSKEKVQSYLSSLPFDLIKIVEEQKTTYHYHSVSYSSKQNLRKALSRESRGAWIELSQGKARYFVDKGWIFSSPQKVSKQEYLQKLEAKAGKTTGIALGLLVMAPGLSELSRHIGSREAALGLTLHKYPMLGLAAYSLMQSQAYAQTVNTEFQVNSSSYGNDHNPKTIGLSNGSFVIVWARFADEREEGIFGRQYDTLGSPMGDEFQISDSNNGFNPDITNLPNGGFVVAWDGLDNSQWVSTLQEIFAQKYTASGMPDGVKFIVNDYQADKQQLPSITSLSDGGLVITWRSQYQDGDGYGIFGQKFDTNGNKTGSEFRVNNYTQGDQSWQNIAPLTAGGFVITWTNSSYVLGQRFNLSGDFLGTEFQLNDKTDGSSLGMEITSLQDGGFLALGWEPDLNSSIDMIVGQRYNNSGHRIGNVFQINSTPSGSHSPSATTLSNENLVVVWSMAAQIYGRLFNATFFPIGEDFPISTFYPSVFEQDPKVARLADGGFVVTWETFYNGEWRGIYAKRFDALGNPLPIPYYKNTTSSAPSNTQTLNSSETSSSLGQSTSQASNSSQASIENMTSLTPSFTPSPSFTSSSTNNTPTLNSSETSSNSGNSLIKPTSTKTLSSKSFTQKKMSSLTSLNSKTIQSTHFSSNLKEDSKPNKHDPSLEKSDLTWLWITLGSLGAMTCIGGGAFVMLRKRHKKEQSIPLESGININSSESKTEENLLVSSNDKKNYPPSDETFFPSIEKRKPKDFGGTFSDLPETVIPEDALEYVPMRNELKLKVMNFRKQGYTEIGNEKGRHTYQLHTKVSKQDAKHILQHTGVVIPFLEGENRVKFQLGEGKYGKVRIAKLKDMTHYFAVKKIKGEREIRESKLEGAFLKKLANTPNIILLYDEFKSIDSNEDKVLYQFMLLAGFGDGDFLMKKLRILKEETRGKTLTHVAQGLLNGVALMQEKSIYHFDIKPDNFMMDKEGNLYIIDFGCAQELLEGELTRPAQGDWAFFSPERLAFTAGILNKKQMPPISAEKAEAWAVGASLLKIVKQRNSFGGPSWDVVSKRGASFFERTLTKELQNLAVPELLMQVIQGLLTVNPDERMSILEAQGILQDVEAFKSPDELAKAFAKMKGLKVQ